MQVAKQRRNLVLDQMAKYHYISRAEANAAKTEELVLAPADKPEEQKDAEPFITFVTQVLIEKYGADAVYKEGLKIYTTIDLDIQRMAQAALLENLPNDYTDANGIQQPQGAIVAIDPKTGYVKAMVGGRGTDQFNRAAQAERQPGSAFKPFVFAAALENGFTPDTVIEDKPINIDGWQPQNDSRRFSGEVPMRTVATFSMNVPTVRIAQTLGMETVIYYAQQMGITTFVLDGDRNDKNYATSLGGMTRGVTPLEIASAYCTFANGGVHIPYKVITKVLDRNGNILEEASPDGIAVIRPESAADLTAMLEDVIKRGTGRAANIGRPAAGKTGTTSNYKDAWFVGYTPDLVAAVWVGNDDNTSTDGIMGGTVPTETWAAFMRKALANVPSHDFDNLVVERRASYAPPRPRESSSSRRNNDNDNYETPEPRYRSEPEEPAYTAPTYNEQPTYNEPTYSEPSYSEPAYNEPSYNEPTYSEPTYSEPTYNEPSYSEPTYNEPSYSEPTYSEPSYSEPSYSDNYDVPSPGDDISKDR